MEDRTLQEISLNRIPDDIPCASVGNSEDVGKWTVPQLKFWLKCRRLNKQELKKRSCQKVSSIYFFAVGFLQCYGRCVPGENLPTCIMCSLVCRVKAFKAIPYYRDKVYDPDPDGSYTKAKLERLNSSSVTEQNILGQTSASSTCFDRFPPDESTLFSEDFSVLPSFVPMDAFEQVKNSGKSSKKSANAEVVINSNDKCLRMMNFLHELQVYNNVEKNIIYLRACCWASYKRNVKYKVKLVINKRGTPKIQAAKCDRQCPTSNSGCCCHVMATIWKLENMTRNSELQNSTPDNRCCTSKPRQWGKGNKREVEFHPVIASTHVKPRHASDLPARKKRGIQSQFYDPRPPKFQNLDVDGIQSQQLCL